MASSDPGVSLSALGIHCSDQVLAGIQRNSMGSILEAGCRLSREGTMPSSLLHQEGLQDERDRMRETDAPGAKTVKVKLPPLQEQRKQQQLTTLYKTVKGHIPVMPPESFLIPAERNRRRIRRGPTTFKDCDPDNTIARHKILNSCGFKI